MKISKILACLAITALFLPVIAIASDINPNTNGEVLAEEGIEEIHGNTPETTEVEVTEEVIMEVEGPKIQIQTEQTPEVTDVIIEKEAVITEEITTEVVGEGDLGEAI